MDPQWDVDGSSRLHGHTAPAMCFKNLLVTSSGLWLGNQPFNYTLPLLMTQLVLFVLTSHAVHYFLRHLGQPLIVSQIVAGMIYGPTLLGGYRQFERTLFYEASKMHIDTIAGVSIMLFMFMLGVKTDLSMIKKTGKKAFSIGILSTLVPFLLVMGADHALRHKMPKKLKNGLFVFHLASTWSRTSYVVLSCILDELNLLNSKLGRIAMSGALIEEFANTVISTAVTSVNLGIHASTPLRGVGSFASFVAFVMFILLVARPIVIWMIRRTPEGQPLDESHFITILCIAYGCGFAGELIGHHSTLGAFFLGLALPGGPPLGSTLDDRLSGYITWIGMPVFIATGGYRINLRKIRNGASVLFLSFFILLTAIGKMIGVIIPCLHCGMSIRDAVILGLMFNTKGIFEVYVLNNWYDAGMVNLLSYSIVMLSVVAFAAVTSCLIKYMYKPSMRYIAYKRRTIQHLKLDAELRLLVCVRSEENVDPLIRLLEVAQFTKESPVCIYILHALQLIGQTAAMLVPYKKSKVTDSDHIVNAFKYLERRNKDTVLVQPFVSIAPQNTMHDDVCSLAFDKKVSLILLPFHKQMGINGTLEQTSHTYRSMNKNVLDYAPCSVAVLINQARLGVPASRGGSTTSSFVSTGGGSVPVIFSEHIGMYFIGGADDRESLSLAMRIVGRSMTIALTVIRFVPPTEWRNYTMEEKLDDEMINEFRFQNRQKSNITYKDQIVKDGEETVGVMRSMKDFTLLIVGRRYKVDSPVTAGLSDWSECPELGIIGDVLASTDYGNNVSTLVVQQQTRFGEDKDGVNCHFALGGTPPDNRPEDEETHLSIESK